MDTSNIRILLVDDDELNRRMMSLLLSGEGYEYETASNGREAVEAVQTGNFNFVLMDLQMPQMDGYEATAKIRAWEAETGHAHTPIVALTAMLFAEETKQCLAAGMDNCLVKPFNTTDLFKLIEAYASEAKAMPVNVVEPVISAKKTNEILDVKAALPRFGNDLDTYRQFLNEFLEMMPDKIAQLQDMFRSKDYKSLTDIAHNLKGVSASLGIMQLSALALQLEQQSQAGNSRSIEETLTEITKMSGTLQKQAVDSLLE